MVFPYQLQLLSSVPTIKFCVPFLSAQVTSDDTVELIFKTHHLHNFHLRFDSQVVQENLQILLNLNRIVFQLCNREDPHFAVFPCAVLLEKEGQKHEQAAIVNHPPDVNVAANLRGGVGEEVDTLGHEQGHA